MREIMNSFYNIKYKTETLEDAIYKKGYGEEFQDEIYDVNIALEYINQMIKKYNSDRKKGIISNDSEW